MYNVVDFKRYYNQTRKIEDFKHLVQNFKDFKHKAFSMSSKEITCIGIKKGRKKSRCLPI